MRRRDLIVGGVCGLAAVTAYGLKPRRPLSLLGGRKLADITPSTLAGWSSADVSNLVQATDGDSLSAQLYDEIVERVFQRPDGGPQVMVMLAHGGAQTNELQVHRPEECYPAFGFSLSQVRDRPVRLGPGSLPTRQIVADAPGRRESILYWVRIGERMPASMREQRTDRLVEAMQGRVPDGLLARFSMLGANADEALRTLEQFIPQFLAGVQADHLSAFVGTRLASAMAAKA